MKKLFLQSLSLLSAGLMMLFISSCASMSAPPQPQVVKEVIVKPERPAKINPIEIDYLTVTQGNMEDKILTGSAYQCLSWSDYLTLAQWEQEKLRWIRQTNLILDYYENRLKEIDNGKEASPPED